jgi:hypothetical protein
LTAKRMHSSDEAGGDVGSGVRSAASLSGHRCDPD